MTACAQTTSVLCPEAASQPCILSVAYPFAPIGPSAVGGSEVILSELESRLPSLGFESVVVAHASSRPQGRMYATPIPAGEITEAVRTEVEAAHQRNLDLALAENPVALVHMHGLCFHRYRVPTDIPVLVTLHLPPSWYPETIWNLPPNVHFVCVSETERQACPASVRERMTVVENGIPLPPLSTLRPAGRYALLLSRICPEKNLHVGIEAARLAGTPVLLAGEVFPYNAHQRYFAEEIQPRLTASGNGHEDRAPTSKEPFEARFLGPVTGAAKARLLARAACLLLPSLAPETSSLCAMEALASGVPVIAMASGAVPEIIDHGRTGFLIESSIAASASAPRAMADAIQRLPELDRRVCRAVAEERFTLDRMLNAYGDLYRRYALRTPCCRTPSAPSLGSAPATNNSHAQAQQTDHVVSEQITSIERLEALTPEWEELWQQDPNATPFQHPAWLIPWWHQFGPEGELRASTLRDAHGLCGLLPTYVYPEPESGTRKLLLLGAGTSDYLDGVFAAPPRALPLATTALQLTLQNLHEGETVALVQLRSSSPLLSAARDGGPACLQTYPADPSSVLHLHDPLPAKARANAGRYRRRAEQRGTLRFTIASSPEQALNGFEDLARLHRERWQNRGEPGVLADPRVLAHHRQAMPGLLQADLLRLFRLTLNDHLLGALYALADAPQRPSRALYLYLIGFDTQFADLSPGTLLLHAVREYACSNGFTRLDLLRGGEAYKQLWGAEPETTFAILDSDPA